MRRITMLVAALLVPAALMAQLEEEWVNTYEGPYGTSDVRGSAVAVDEDGYAYACGFGYGLSGDTTVGEMDYVTLKYNPLTGETLWVRYYNGPGNGFDRAFAIAVDNTGGVYVTGYSYGSGTSCDYATIKYNASDGGRAWDVASPPDYVVDGVARFDAGSPWWDLAPASIAVDNSGDVYVTGTFYASNNWDWVTVKYNASDGSRAWDATDPPDYVVDGVARYDGGSTYNGHDFARAIAVDNSGGVYVFGQARLFNVPPYTDIDYATIKYNASDGGRAWDVENPPDHVVDGVAYSHEGAYEYARAMVVDNDGGVYVTGEKPVSSTRWDYETVKYNASDGSRAWDVENPPDNVMDGVARYVGGRQPQNAHSLAVDNDGGVYVTGTSYVSGNCADFLTVKYNASDGGEAWSSAALYDGPDNGVDMACAIAVDNSGGVYVTGESYDSDMYADYATVKYNASDGGEEWSSAARYDAGYGSAYPDAMALDGSGGVYVTGYSYGVAAGITTVKYATLDGDEAWVARNNDPEVSEEQGQKVAVDEDGYVYACGYGDGPSGNWDYITLKYDPSDGDTLWVRYYNGLGNGPDSAHAIAVDNDGGVYVTGSSRGTSEGQPYIDYATVKYDASNGDVEWVARYNGGYDDVARAIAVDTSGGVYITGRSNSSPLGLGYVTIKYNASDGGEEWVSRYDGPGGNWAADWANAIAVDNDGGVYVTGHSTGSGTGWDYATIKYDASDGDTVWTARYDGPAGGDDYGVAIAVDNDGGVYVTGQSYGSGTGPDYVTIKYNASDGGRAWDVTVPPEYVVDGAARYHGSGNSPYYDHDGARAIAVDNSGGVYVTGWTRYAEYGTIKYNASDGGRTWDVTDPPDNVVDGVACRHGRAEAIAVNANGVYVTGADYGCGTARYDPESGEEVGYARYTVSVHNAGGALSIATDGAGSVYASGWLGTIPGGQYTAMQDIVTIKYLVGTYDVGVAEITEPSGLIDTLPEIPEATVQNFGSVPATFKAYFEITDSATGSQAYFESAQVTGLAAGACASVEFPEWHVPNDSEGRYYSLCYTLLSGDADGTNDSAWSQFAVEAAPQAPAMWSRWLDVPEGSQSRDVQHGAALATDPLGMYVFLLKGNNTCEFYVCDPGESTWTTLEAIPLEGRDAIPRTVKEGGALAQVGGKYYATKGGNCLEFWEYDPEADEGEEWSQKADVPAGDAGVHSGASAAGVMVGDYAYVYLLKASSTNEYYRYNVFADTWEEMASAPSSEGQKYKKGTSISYDGIDTIYVLKGIENDFHAYVVSEDEWLTRPELPEGDKKKQAKGGACIVYHNRNVWCLKGSNSQEFWVYKCDSSVWRRADDIPLGDHRSRVEDGGAMVYCRYHRYLFATKGHSLEFWSYGKLTNYGIQGGDVVSLDKGPVTRFELGVRPSITRDRAEVRYALPRAGRVMVRLFDVSGRQAAVLADGWHESGRYTANVDAKGLARGVYILKLKSDDCDLGRKVVIE